MKDAPDLTIHDALYAADALLITPSRVDRGIVFLTSTGEHDSFEVCIALNEPAVLAIWRNLGQRLGKAECGGAEVAAAQAEVARLREQVTRIDAELSFDLADALEDARAVRREAPNSYGSGYDDGKSGGLREALEVLRGTLAEQPLPEPPS